MSRVIFFFLICFFLLNGMVKAGEVQPEKGCKNNPEIVDKCFSMYGRIFASNGTPSVRILRIGTKRIYGVIPAENELMPEHLKKQLDFNTNIYGDLLLCPFTKEQAGYMRDVCIESAENIRVIKKKPKTNQKAKNGASSHLR